MKKILLVFVLVVGLASMAMSDAYARRLGGGFSFGRQSSNIGRIAPMQRSMGQPAAPAQQAQRAANQSQAANAARPASRWGGILGGALLGLGLGALLSHFGIGGDMAGMISTILMLVIIVYAVRFLMRRSSGRQREQNANAYAGNYQETAYNNHSATPEIGSGLPHSFSGNPNAAADAQNDTWGIPADFDVPAFLRAAKSYFIRLQAAWDKGDINDIHEFTTPEMFAEIRLQLQERGDTPNVTDVVSLDAELLGIETLSNEYMASVKFSGKIRETEGAEPEQFEEIWNFTRPVSRQSGWVLAGIQQLS